MPNPIVLSERPLMGVLQEDDGEVQKTGHITFAKTADGQFLAKMTQNGREFVGKHPEQFKAMAAVQQAVDTAERQGRTWVDAHPTRTKD